MAERTSPAYRSLLRIGIILQLPLALLCFAIYVASASAAGAPASPEAVKHGEDIFKTRCIICHNKKPGDNSPFGPPNLFSAFSGPKALTNEQAETQITNGKPPMPPFGSVLSKEEIHDVIGYLRAQAATAPK